MKFHKQLALYNPTDKISTGSCYPTAIACVLDLELHEVPYVNLLYFYSSGDIIKNNLDFYIKQKYLKGVEYDKAEDYQKENYDNIKSELWNLWDKVMELFLASRGYYLDYIPDFYKFIKDNPNTPYFVSGLSERNIGHIVIYKDGQPYHDPHPSNSFLKPEDINNKYTYQALFPISEYNNSGKYYIKE